MNQDQLWDAVQKSKRQTDASEVQDEQETITHEVSRFTQELGRDMTKARRHMRSGRNL